MTTLRQNHHFGSSIGKCILSKIDMKIHFLENSLFGKFTCKFTLFFRNWYLRLVASSKKLDLRDTWRSSDFRGDFTSLYSDALKATIERGIIVVNQDNKVNKMFPASFSMYARPDFKPDSRTLPILVQSNWLMPHLGGPCVDNVSKSSKLSHWISNISFEFISLWFFFSNFASVWTRLHGANLRKDKWGWPAMLIFPFHLPFWARDAFPCRRIASPSVKCSSRRRRQVLQLLWKKYTLDVEKKTFYDLKKDV